MAETSFTGIKSNKSELVFDCVNRYFKEHKLLLVEERIGDRTGKFMTSPKHYNDLRGYEDSELKPYLGKNQSLHSFSTNFDVFVNIPENPKWSLLVYNPRLASYTLNIDEDLTSFISKELETEAFDFYEYSVINQVITRGFKNGDLVDGLLVPGGGAGDIDTAEGYFEKLNELPQSGDLSEEDLERQSEIIFGFWEHIKYQPIFIGKYDYDESVRRPMYLKGSSDNILTFLRYKVNTFYII